MQAPEPTPSTSLSGDGGAGASSPAPKGDPTTLPYEPPLPLIDPGFPEVTSPVAPGRTPGPSLQPPISPGPAPSPPTAPGQTSSGGDTLGGGPLGPDLSGIGSTLVEGSALSSAATGGSFLGPLGLVLGALGAGVLTAVSGPAGLLAWAGEIAALLAYMDSGTPNQPPSPSAPDNSGAPPDDSGGDTTGSNNGGGDASGDGDPSDPSNPDQPPPGPGAGGDGSSSGPTHLRRMRTPLTQARWVEIHRMIRECQAPNGAPSRRAIHPRASPEAAAHRLSDGLATRRLPATLPTTSSWGTQTPTASARCWTRPSVPRQRSPRPFHRVRPRLRRRCRLTSRSTRGPLRPTGSRHWVCSQVCLQA